MRLLLIMVLLTSIPALAQKRVDRARQGGPQMGETRRLTYAPQEVLGHMFRKIEQQWFGPAYSRAGQVEFRARIDAKLPAAAGPRGMRGGGGVDFDVTVDGIATPNGHYRMEVEGDLGTVEMIKDNRRRFMSSPTFKSFSDSPIRNRSENANLTSYRSYALKYLNAMRERIMNSGQYRSVYVGTGAHQGREVHVLRVYRPSYTKKKVKNRAERKKRPMPLNKLWNFWHDGGYEIWVYRDNWMPAVVFYTNNDDNVYANFSIDYDRDNMPMRISYNNNSLKSEGNGDIVLNYDRDKMLRGFSLKFESERGVSLRMDATLAFGEAPEKEAFRIIPPFGFKKLNRDHLELMVLTQISGGLLKLKKYGINFKNFKF